MKAAQAVAAEAAGSDGDVVMVAAPPEEDDRMCRFCFCGAEEGELISPCRCCGDQKWVHSECLLRWQRAVLVTQPTHPSYYRVDQRQNICNVCKAPFDPPAPPRAVLMMGFTGVQLAALLEEGRLIVCEPRTSRHMQHLLESVGHIVGASSLRHWIRGVFLITEVTPSGASNGEDRITAVNLTREIHEDAVRSGSGAPGAPRGLGHRSAEWARVGWGGAGWVSGWGVGFR